MYYRCTTIATFGLYVPTVSEGQKTRDKREDDAVDHRREEQARYRRSSFTQSRVYRKNIQERKGVFKSCPATGLSDAGKLHLFLLVICWI
jgi:hypothetical protein